MSWVLLASLMGLKTSDGAGYDEKRDWFHQNVRLMKALTQKGYDVNYSWGMNLHGQKFGGAIMPEMMRWLWRDGPVSTDPNDKVERDFRQPVLARYGADNEQQQDCSKGDQQHIDLLKAKRSLAEEFTCAAAARGESRYGRCHRKHDYQ